jgi:hypothetical protein
MFRELPKKVDKDLYTNLIDKVTSNLILNDLQKSLACTE